MGAEAGASVRSSGPPYPSFSEGMLAVIGPLKTVFCKQAQVMDEGDSYSAQSSLLCTMSRGVCMVAVSAGAGIEAPVTPVGNILHKLFQLGTGEIKCTPCDCTGKNPEGCRLDSSRFCPITFFLYSFCILPRQ